MMRLSDYFIKRLADTYRVQHIFMISGGGNMHLIDALGRNTQITYIPNHHEQACAIAAEAYSRINGDLGVCLVTTGPGGTNAVTGVFGAWVDSIPTLFISGQVKKDTLAMSGMRQLGDQEANMIDIVKPITKYAVMVDNPHDIQYHLDKAIFIAKSGRQGPVWLDIPLDIQSAHINESDLLAFSDEEKMSFFPNIDTSLLKKQVFDFCERLTRSARPVLFVGNGIRLAHGENILQEVIKKLRIPVLSSFNGMDLVDQQHPYFFGRPGTIGGRAANFILQNSDLFLSVGSRLNIRITSYNYQALAREAYKIVVDIDPSELHKKTLAKFDMRIQSDALTFLQALDDVLGQEGYLEKKAWLDYCRHIKERYPVVTQEYKNMPGFVSVYHFLDKLSDALSPEAMVAMGDGMACVIPYKVFKVKFGQRLVLNSGCAAMGYDLPAAIGICFANKKRETICITGDGSIMLNLQEFQTIVHNKLPIKIFILDNAGYLSIRSTQDTYFGGLHVGSDASSGVSCPDFIKVAQAFGMATNTISVHDEVERKIAEVLKYPGAVVCTVKLNPKEEMLPKLSSAVKPDGSMVSKPLEDLYPFLPREEFHSNMLIPTYNA